PSQTLQCRRKTGLLLQRKPVMPRRFQVTVTHLINASQIEVREGIRFVARRKQRSFEPAYAAVRIAFAQQVAANVVVGISQGLVDANGLQAFGNCFVVSFLKAVYPTKKSMGLSGWICINRALVKLYGSLIILGLLSAICFMEELLGFVFGRGGFVILHACILHDAIVSENCRFRIVE